MRHVFQAERGEPCLHVGFGNTYTHLLEAGLSGFTNAPIRAAKAGTAEDRRKPIRYSISVLLRHLET
jgi:hypothetical protein